MAADKRSLIPWSGSLTPAPQFDGPSRGMSYEQQWLAAKAREEADHQRWVAALNVQGQQLTTRLAEHAADMFEEGHYHNREMVERAKATGDEQSIQTMSRFANQLDGDLATALRHSFRVGSSDILGIAHEMASQRPPRRPPGLVDRILGRK